mmetsp:Transcript_36197/g.104185  ORF Transcript_36197/g.104185 Transcript_36197/m.104185 type:complete len:231 (-) Transcript_36197:729-1421(-)
MCPEERSISPRMLGREEEPGGEYAGACSRSSRDQIRAAAAGAAGCGRQRGPELRRVRRGLQAPGHERRGALDRERRGGLPGPLRADGQLRALRLLPALGVLPPAGRVRDRHLQQPGVDLGPVRVLGIRAEPSDHNHPHVQRHLLRGGDWVLPAGHGGRDAQLVPLRIGVPAALQEPALLRPLHLQLDLWDLPPGDGGGGAGAQPGLRQHRRAAGMPRAQGEASRDQPAAG